MIKNYSDYKFFLEEDRKALGRRKTFLAIVFDKIWKYQRALRRLEYVENTQKFICIRLICKLYFRYLSTKLGFSIPINCFGPGLSIAHYGTIVVNEKVKVGANCRIHVCVNIGAGNKSAPILGNNVYIGPGAKIFGDIIIGNNVKIGANAVVNKSFVNDNIIIAGVPAKIVKKTYDN